MEKKKGKDDGESEVVLEDFVEPSKVFAFCNMYRPADHWSEACDTFTDSQLRTYFKAVVCPLGDPLAIYLGLLSSHGFHLVNDECGEPVIYALPK